MNFVLAIVMNKLEDPRIDGRISYPLDEIILVAFATILLLSGNRTKQIKPLNLVNAWASANRCALGCHAVESKTNEVTAIPEVLKLLSLKGAVVVIDAIDCQNT